MGSRTGAAILAALFLFAMVPWARAQDVTLTSRDGSIVLQGTMRSHDGDLYRILTRYGVLTLDASAVRCAGPGCPGLADPPPVVVMAVPATAAGLMPLLIEGFAKAEGLVLVRAAFGDAAGSYGLRDGALGREVVRITVQILSAKEVLAELASGKAQIALSLDATPMGAKAVAMEAAVVLVGKNNPIRSISPADLASVLAGGITNWASLGGGDAPVELHLLDELAGLPLLSVLPLETQATRHAEAHALAAAVARDPWALGVSTFATTGAARLVDLTGTCGIALRASDWTIRSGDYPLSFPLSLSTGPGKLPLIARQWVDWLTSPQAQAAVRAAGWVDMGPTRLGVEAQGGRLADAIRAVEPDGLPGLQDLVAGLAGAARLSTTFRFEHGRNRLDAPSQGAIATLARDLEAGLHDGQEVILAGFASKSAAGLAEAVREALVASAPLMNARRVRLVAAGYGALMPLACDDGLGDVNRRVEVWLRPWREATDSLRSGN